MVQRERAIQVEECDVMIRLYAAVAGLAVLLAGPALAKTSHPVHRAKHAIHRGSDVRYAQSYYDYHSESLVREEFQDGPRTSWRRDGYFGRSDFYREHRDGVVVENLRSGDFTGGVGYGVDGDVPSFVDGFGQTHFFVGDFRRMAPGSRFGDPRFRAPGFGFHRGFR